MKYYAFLRGINISGKNKVPMKELKTAFEELGFTQVSTYLNSGNVCFSSESNTVQEIRNQLESMIQTRFEITVPVFVIEDTELQEIMNHSPAWWGNEDKEKYHNLIFILTEDTPEQIYNLIGNPDPSLETVEIYKNIIFWTFDRIKYQKCLWWKKTAAPGIGEKLTIRTARTISQLTK